MPGPWSGDAATGSTEKCQSTWKSLTLLLSIARLRSHLISIIKKALTGLHQNTESRFHSIFVPKNPA